MIDDIHYIRVKRFTMFTMYFFKSPAILSTEIYCKILGERLYVHTSYSKSIIKNAVSYVHFIIQLLQNITMSPMSISILYSCSSSRGLSRTT